MHEALESAFSLDGRVAVVTGAAGGIGREAAITFAQAGADIVIADVGEEGLAGTAEDCNRCVSIARCRTCCLGS